MRWLPGSRSLPLTASGMTEGKRHRQTYARAHGTRHAGEMDTDDDEEPTSGREAEARALRQLWALYTGDDSDEANLMRARFVATANRQLAQ